MNVRKTTDNQNEIFDVVDEEDNVIGQATRREVHKNKSLIHRSIGVVIFNSRGEIFLQQRSATKDTDPMLWTISCSGHVPSGETYEETVLRELKEELGVIYKGTPYSTARGPLEKVAKYLCRAPNETEMQMLFKIEFSKEVEPHKRFNLNKEEILQGKFFTRSQLERAIKGGEIELSFMGKVALEKIGWV